MELNSGDRAIFPDISKGAAVNDGCNYKVRHSSLRLVSLVGDDILPITRTHINIHTHASVCARKGTLTSSHIYSHC